VSEEGASRLSYSKYKKAFFRHIVVKWANTMRVFRPVYLIMHSYTEWALQSVTRC